MRRSQSTAHMRSLSNQRVVVKKSSALDYDNDPFRTTYGNDFDNPQAKKNQQYSASKQMISLK